MSGVNSVSPGMGPIDWIGALRSGAQTPPKDSSQVTSPDQTQASDAIKSPDNVQNENRPTASTIQDLISGRSPDVAPAIDVMMKSDQSFKLMLGIRNKIVEAYKIGQTLREME